VLEEINTTKPGELNTVNAGERRQRR
jgi:hypothetical protein